MTLFHETTVMQVRIARPTDRLDALEDFYHRIVGLPKITAWRHGIDGDHHGYDGLILGMPDGRYHLEFTHHGSGSPGPAPSRDHLLVFYLAPDDVERMASRMQAFGIAEVEPENPWWEAGGHTYEDPEGGRVVFMPGPGVTRVSISDNDSDDASPLTSTMNGTTP
ncbi:MAG: VOC family protein [Thermomicrobiales bacterium]